jgi:hypothetical protein
LDKKGRILARYFSFLRTHSKGGHPLRELFEPTGFSDVEASIASGNVEFEKRPGKRAT